MEEKKSIKVSLGTVVCIFIIIVLVIGIAIMYVQNDKRVKELETQKTILESQKDTLVEKLNTVQESNEKIINELNKQETLISTESKEDETKASNNSILSNTEIQKTLGPDDALFCIEDITKSGDEYIITAYMLEKQPRKISTEEYNDLKNGKEIQFRNQKWKINSANELVSGEDKLSLNSDKTIGNIAGAVAKLCDYSSNKISFKVSKNILIGRYWTTFKYDNNGNISAYSIDTNEKVKDFESISFDTLKELSKGCKGTYDQCEAYVKNGIVGAIKIFEK